MPDRRRANVNWDVADEAGAMPTWERIGIAVLMDIRDELQTLNRLLGCQNFTSVPRTLRKIATNTTKRRRTP